MGFFFHLFYFQQFIITFVLHFLAIISLPIMSSFFHRKKIKAVQKSIDEFNKKMTFKNILAEWNSDYYRIGQRNYNPRPELHIKKKLQSNCYYIQVDSVQNSEEMHAPPSYQEIFGSK